MKWMRRRRIRSSRSFLLFRVSFSVPADHDDSVSLQGEAFRLEPKQTGGRGQSGVEIIATRLQQLQEQDSQCHTEQTEGGSQGKHRW